MDCKHIKSYIKRYIFNVGWNCNLCGKEIFKNNFCEDCYNSLPFIQNTFCEHCGRYLSESRLYCPSCIEKNLSFDKARSVYMYEDKVAQLIKKLKYNNASYLSEVLGEQMLEKLIKFFPDANLLTFVPMTEKRKKKRGYNQSELLAEYLSDKSGIPLADCLLKTVETLRQANLGREDRLKNLQGSFAVKDKKILKGKTVIIVDDVLTTGSTAETLSMLLKKSGAVRVYVLTVASVQIIK